MDKIAILVIFLITANIVAQEHGSLTGKVLDLEMNKEPMLLVNVQLKGQPQKAETNFHGNFELLDVPVGEHTLVVSYAGYDNLEIPVRIEKDKTSKIQCELSQKTILLSDYAVNTTDRTDFHLSPASSLK